MNNNLKETSNISRRDFLKYTVGIGSSVIAGTTILASCSTEKSDNVVKDESLTRGPAWSEYNLETYCEGYKEDKEADSLKDEYRAVKNGEIYKIYYYNGKYYGIFEGYEDK